MAHCWLMVVVYVRNMFACENSQHDAVCDVTIWSFSIEYVVWTEWLRMYRDRCVSVRRPRTARQEVRTHTNTKTHLPHSPKYTFTHSLDSTQHTHTQTQRIGTFHHCEAHDLTARCTEHTKVALQTGCTSRTREPRTVRRTQQSALRRDFS